MLVVSLALVKGGTPTFISLIWSSFTFMSMIIFLALVPAQSLHSHISHRIAKIKNSKSILFSAENAFYLLLLFQLWLFLQILFGISQNMQATQDDLILGMGFVATLLLMSLTEWHQRYKKIFIFALIALGVVQALYGLWVFLSQINQILWMEKLFYLDKPTGTFVNANHFCSYLSLVFILMMSYVFCHLQHKKQSTRANGSTFSVLEQLYSPFGLIFILFLFAILATRSIGGIGSLFIVILIVAVAMLYKRVSKLQVMVGLSCVFIVALLIVLNSDFHTFSKELNNLEFTLKRRLAISQAAFRMVIDNWFVGVGAGAFYSSFSPYRDLSVGNSFYHFAHNDYLQFWAEYGLIGIVILCIMVIQCIRVNCSVLKQSRNVYRRTFAYASIYSTLLIAIHSVVDFPLQIPGFALLYLIIIFFNVMIVCRSGQLNNTP